MAEVVKVESSRPARRRASAPAEARLADALAERRGQQLRLIADTGEGLEPQVRIDELVLFVRDDVVAIAVLIGRDPENADRGDLVGGHPGCAQLTLTEEARALSPGTVVSQR